ncbi:DUF3418 domain-containing protein [Rothia dentocariosa]|nr:DUF3418 domain-containing protein [Rothia dentocariosa]
MTKSKNRNHYTCFEELRVSFFAQELGTAYTVSEKRIAKAQREALEQVKR